MCPHCEEEIALDDDASGEFLCPLCDGEFEWNINPDNDRQEASSIEAEERARARSLGLEDTAHWGIRTLFIMGIVMIAMGSIGLAFCQDIWAEMNEPQGDSFSSRALSSFCQPSLSGILSQAGRFCWASVSC